MTADRARVVDAIREADRFLVTCHVNPDGDALASAIALTLGLKSLGKTAMTYNQDGVPHMLSFLPGSDEVVTQVDGRLTDDTVVCVTDCGALDRIGEMAQEFAKRTIVNLDHHTTNTRFGTHNLIDADASASGVVVYDVLTDLGVTLTPAMATNILTTIIVDTGSFHYASTNKHAFEVAGAAVEAGADPHYVSSALFEREREQKLHLLGDVLGTLQRSPCGRYAWVKVTQEMFQKTGAEPQDVEGFVEMGRTIEGVEVSALFREIDPDHYKVSLRAKDVVDVAAILEGFGGGGHIRAAGATVASDLEALQKSLFEKIERALDDADVPRCR